jgi:hypothetical protein
MARLIALIGFIAAVVGLYAFFFTDTPLGQQEFRDAMAQNATLMYVAIGVGAGVLLLLLYGIFGRSKRAH